MSKKECDDIVHRAANFADHNRGLCAGLALAAAAALWLGACQPRTQSLLDPARRVTAGELQRELAQVESEYAARLRAGEAALRDLQAQYESRARVAQLAGGAAALAVGGDLTPSALVGSLLQFLTLFGAAGLAYDNRRKDRVIAGRSAGAKGSISPPEGIG